MARIEFRGNAIKSVCYNECNTVLQYDGFNKEISVMLCQDLIVGYMYITNFDLKIVC